MAEGRSTAGPLVPPHAAPTGRRTGSDPSTPFFLFDELPDAWAEFMGRHQWEWFVTLTFKDSVHPEAADKLWRLWCKRLDCGLLGRETQRVHPEFGVVWVRGLEFQRRGVAHFHALMRWVGELDHRAGRFVWMGEWQRLSNSFAKIVPVRSQVEAARYVSKYVAKGGEVDISPNYHRTLAQQGLALA